jgi:PIN domain nuclease of toxin-antitoxin system
VTYLLDTNVVLWFLAADERLSPSVVRLMEQRMSQCRVSVVSLWEIILKRRLGKLELPGDIFDVLEAMQLRQLDLTERQLQAFDELDAGAVRDPFDQLLTAQALAERMVFVTSDAKVLQEQSAGLSLLDSRQS